MDNNKIIELIELALENKLISIEDLTNIINKMKNKGVFIENPQGPIINNPTESSVNIPQGPTIENSQGLIINKPTGSIIENPSEKEFDILEEERQRIERIHEQDSEEYDFPGRKI